MSLFIQNTKVCQGWPAQGTPFEIHSRWWSNSLDSPALVRFFCWEFTKYLDLRHHQRKTVNKIHRIRTYAIYGNIYHQYTPVLFASIYHTWILWETYSLEFHINSLFLLDLAIGKTATPGILLWFLLEVFGFELSFFGWDNTKWFFLSFTEQLGISFWYCMLWHRKIVDL